MHAEMLFIMFFTMIMAQVRHKSVSLTRDANALQ
jgi:hypothetical protein